MIKLTKLQQQAVKRLWLRGQLLDKGVGYVAFRRTVQPSWDCAMVEWCGMLIGIEKDGYTHS
jgi:hypothetical protein